MLFRKFLIVSFIILITALAACFIFRNNFLEWAFAKARNSAHQQYHLKISKSHLSFAGIDRIRIQSLVVQPDDADTLISVNHAELNISLKDLLYGKIGFDDVKVNGAQMAIYNEEDRNNIQFLLRSNRPKKRVSTSSSRSYREMADNLKEKIFRSLNTAFTLHDIRVTYSDSSLTESIFLPHVEYDFHKLSGLLINQKVGDTTIFSGAVIEKNKSMQLSVQHLAKDSSYLPFLDRERSLKFRFQSINAKLSFENTSGELLIHTDLEGTDFQINHWRIANNDVVFPDVRFKGLFRISDTGFELDSSSAFILRHVTFGLFANYSHITDTVYALSISMPETEADSFFNALPDGMFHTLKGISCSGTLAYDLQFFINTREPDSLKFYSYLRKKDLKLNHYGAEDYSRINQSFVYEAFDKDRFVRPIIVGFENPNFAPLGMISSKLSQAVLQAEDPSFMNHRGFLPEAFRESIIQNYKERRFARGGSTISMQLVKNVFLSRNKTISRKVEEALIVYLLENLGLVSKERMFEIYLNVIEWGPNIYGIGEASRFYFNKKPSEINLQESIFLSALIPMPKYFKYQFDKEGKLRPYLSDYFRIISSRLVRRGWLSPEDTVNLTPNVKLKGPARLMVTPAGDAEIIEDEEF